MSIEITVEHEARICLAAIENGLPVIRRLSLRNVSTAPLTELELEVSLDPQIGPPTRVQLAAIPPNSVHVLEGITLEISTEGMRSLPEAVMGHLRVRVCNTEELGAEEVKVEILPSNEWPGTAALPELLAAFVAPNSACLDGVLVKTQALLRQKFTGRDALDGYQSGSHQRVADVVQSLYETVQAYGLSYITSPASFEQHGQKVRSHTEVLQTQRGSCLDLSLLFCALMEQCGLHAVIVLLDGHALPGLWLTDFHLSCPSMDDPLPLRKRVALDEAMVFESTLLTSGGSFAEACRLASEHLAESERFGLMVDLKAARLSGIRPLWSMSGVGSSSSTEPQERSTTDETSQASLCLDSPVAVEPTSAESLRDKITRWKGKLLDTSLRNRLLNFKEGKKAVRVRFSDLAVLEDALAARQSFKVLAGRPPAGGAPATVLDLAETPDREREIVAEGQAKGELYTDLTPRETHKRLTEQFRFSRSVLEETGAHTMYLAMGFLRWRPRQSPGQDRLAPLLLMPVQIKRGRGDSPFEFVCTGEDTQNNVTLLKVLRDDFGLSDKDLDVLPEDHSGIDVPQVLRRFKQLVLNQDGWEVLEECYLAPFTFSKFLMWRDIDATEDLILENDVVRHICLGGGTPYPLEAPFLAENELDAKVRLADVPLVCDADPSQMAAIMAVRDGSSFVLEGPPGTGKSQTITNLIANAVFDRKTVLFVSEKMAALEVVKRRLEQAGLGEFCLELHSNKANKRAVIQQLQTAAEVGRHRTTVESAKLVDGLVALQAQLNSYAKLLREPSSFGPTAFEILSELIGLKEAPVVGLEIGEWKKERLTEVQHAELDIAVRALEVASKSVPDPARHPWRQCVRETWRDPWKREVLESIDAALSHWAELGTVFSPPLVGLGLRLKELNIEQLIAVGTLLKETLKTPSPPAHLLQGGPWSDVRGPIDLWLKCGLERERLWCGEPAESGRRASPAKPGLRAGYSADLLTLRLGHLERCFAKWGSSHRLVRFFMLWSSRRALRAVSLAPKLSFDRRLLDDIRRAQVIVRTDKYLHQVSGSAQSTLGRRFWRGIETDWSGLSRMLNWVERFRGLVPNALAGERMAEARQRLFRWVTTESDQLADGLERHRELSDTCAAIERLVDQLDTLGLLLQPRQRASKSAPGTGVAAFVGPLGAQMAQLEAMRSAPGRLRHWCSWKRAERSARGLGLGPLVDAWLDDDAESSVFPAQLRIAHQRSILHWWWSGYAAAEPVLDLTGDERDDLVQRFQSMDREWLTKSRELVRAKVLSGLPHPDAPGDMAVLRKQFQLQRRHMPIRRLFKEMPDLIQSLMPCVLMSPLSVAKYLSPGSDSAFDLVIFDEASQIPPWDAIGAIARGKKQVVIVGDTKQLPPTSFFNRQASEEDDDDGHHPWDITDVESILAEARASGIVGKSLRWHYRSRHEALIAFSNHHYYDGELNIFPSVCHSAPDLGVQLWPVDQTFYDRGKSTTNRGEAMVIADEIVRRLRDPVLSQKSLGVVTFNSHQQHLIEDLLDQARVKHPQIDKYFSSQVKEPVFIKNLENVQGDERDVMLFSICYGPDASGKVTMYFGPLNNKGGERRLNVAVTRAKELMIVVSSLRHEQIDLSRSNAVGVHHLRAFLHYARSGIRALDAGSSRAVSAEECSALEADIKSWLEQEGYEVHSRVGCAGYRIDLGIVHPDKPGSYLLGVESDGATYHSSANARSRDRQRQQVLEGLGWSVHRVWSTEWFYSRAEEQSKLRAAIAEALQVQPDPAEAEPAAPDPAPLEPVDWVPPVYDTVRIAPNQQPYIAAIHRTWGSRDEFYEVGSRPAIRECILEIIQAEGPVQSARGDRLVVRSWGFSSLGSRLRRCIHREIGQLEAQGKVRRVNGFYWPKELALDDWSEFRVPGTAPESDRSAAEIPAEEAANAGWWLLYQARSITRPDLNAEIGRLMGFSRAGGQVRSMGAAGIDLLLQSGRARMLGERAQWVDRESPFVG